MFQPDPDNVSLILTDAPAGWCLRDDAEPEITTTGWDNLRLEYFGRFDTGNPSQLIAAGSPILYTGSGNWGAVSSRTKQIAGPFYSGSVNCQGIGSSKGNKVRWTIGTETASAEDVTGVPGVTGIAPKATARMPKVGVEISYISVGAPYSDAGKAGQQDTPPSPRPPDPQNPWSSIALDQANFNHPAGWVLDGVDAEEVVPGSNLWFVTLRYVYQFDVTL